MRQKRLARIVIAALGGCAAILVAAGIARALRPHDATSTPTSTSTSTSTSTPTPTPTPTPTAAATPAPAPTTGTLTLDRPATPGKVWLDGKKVTVKSGDVPCGKHQLKIGQWGKAKPISVPCGAELHVSK